jgi:hypothetical protein
MQGREWKEEGDLVIVDGRIYIPKDVQLRHDLVYAHHNSPIAGHQGKWKTLELILCNYWWPGIS